MTDQLLCCLNLLQYKTYVYIILKEVINVWEFSDSPNEITKSYLNDFLLEVKKSAVS